MSQSLSSMTGFARAERQAGSLRVRVEVKSVNGRGLDLRLRLAPGLDIVDVPLRQALTKALTRGSVNLAVTLDRSGSAVGLRVNEAALDATIAALALVRSKVDTVLPQPEGILALPGILVDDGAGDADEDALVALILECANQAIASLKAARIQEGAEIAGVLNSQLDTIADLVGRAEGHPARDRGAIQQRLREQIAVLAMDISLPPDRLAQEALLLATKADVQEELDRLKAHIAAAKTLIAQGGPVGRRLDFLAQEFNREANTLCSKSNAVDLTAIGLDLKAVIDQLREQIQNIE